MIDLDSVQQDALQEIGNVGLGNAMTALSQLSGQTFHITVPKVCQTDVSSVPFLFGDPERLAVGASVLVTGDWMGEAAFLLSWKSACVLWESMLGQSPADQSEFTDMHTSMIGEVANIMLGSYLNAISEMTGFMLSLEPPAFFADMSAAILSSLMIEAMTWDYELLMVQTSFEASETNFEGFFLYLPEIGGMKRLFETLGI